MNRAHGNVTGHSYLYIFIVLFLIRIQTVSIKQIIILIIKTGNHFYDLIFHLQISVRLDICESQEYHWKPSLQVSELFLIRIVSENRQSLEQVCPILIFPGKNIRACSCSVSCQNGADA